MAIRVFPSLEELSQAAAEVIAERCRIAAASRGRALIALSGGSTPNRTYEILAGLHVPWDAVHVVWVDERYVPHDHPASNEGAARKALLDKVPIPPGQIHPMYMLGGVEAAAKRYDALLGDILRDGPIDLCVMGMGADGHTASLFPGSPALLETTRRAVAAYGAGAITQRITLTPPILAASHLNLFLVAGAEKSVALKAVLEPEAGVSLLPAAFISTRSQAASWFVESAAASMLTT